MEQECDSRTRLQQRNQDEIDLKHLFNIIRRSLLRICLITILIAAVAAIFITQLPPIYKATAVLQLQTEKPSLISIKGVLQNELNNNDYFQTQIAILRSDRITEKVVTQLKLHQYPYYTQPAPVNLFMRGLKHLPDWPLLTSLKQTFQPDISQQNMSPNAPVFNAQIKSAISINPVKNTQLINISYEHQSPELAALIANAYADVYIQHNREFRIQPTINASHWLEDGVQVLRNNLTNAEQNLADFLQQENLIDDSGVDNLTSNELKNLTTKLNLIRNEKIIAETLFQQVNQAQNLDLLTLTSNKALSSHPVITELRNDYTQIKNRLAELSKRYGPLHDKMIHANTQLAVVEDNAKKSLQQLALSFKQNLLLIDQNELAITAALEQKKAKYREIIKQKTRYNALSRELSSSSELYSLFLVRLKETNLTNDLNLSTASLADTAKPPLAPFKPNRVLIFVLVILLTIIILILHALFRSFCLINQDNIVSLTPPLLGTLPNLKSAEKQFKQLSPQQLFQSNKMVFEAAQSLRTSLQLSISSQKQQVIVITSAAIGEGKSTATIYLAMALAQTHKTIIIEADMRKPSIGKKMGIPKTHTGLSDILTNGGSLSDSIWYDEQTKLSVMPASEPPDSPLNLLSSKRFKSCLTILKSQYDYIIIDSPPCQLVSDTFVIGQSADINIVVTRSNHSKKNELDDTIVLLAKHNIKVNGIILNNVSLQDDKRYQYQYHKKVS